MAGQVKHTQIFLLHPPRLASGQATAEPSHRRNTDMLLGAVAKVLADEGIELISSTHYLEPLLARPGVLTQPRAQRRGNARTSPTAARLPVPSQDYDLGQTVVIAAQACVAIEAMEGTDATIERAGDLFRRSAMPPPPSAVLSPSSRSPSPTRTCASTCPLSASKPSKPWCGRALPASPSRPVELCLFDADAIVAAADRSGIAILAE